MVGSKNTTHSRQAQPFEAQDGYVGLNAHQHGVQKAIGQRT